MKLSSTCRARSSSTKPSSSRKRSAPRSRARSSTACSHVSRAISAARASRAMIETLHFVEPDLRAIDTTSAEVIACSTFEDERPIRGLAGLLDWRLAGRLSALAKAGFSARRSEDEVVIVPGRPHLPFEKVIVLGLGPRAKFDERSCDVVLERLRRARRLNVKRALVEMPGRGTGKLDASHAAELLLECAQRRARARDVDARRRPRPAEKMMAQKLVRRRDARSRPDA